MDRYVVIMAGGSGTRFWPKSRRALPKQLLAIFTGRTMVEEALARALELAPAERVLIITTAEQAGQTGIIVGGKIPAENVIAEPFGRDTAPCIALAYAAIRRKSKEAVMLIMPADHVIRPLGAFVRTAQAGFEAAEQEQALITFGVPPTYPATGYGYICAGDVAREIDGVRVMRVGAFKEKPDADTAMRFLEAGNYYWNSGMFVWTLSTISSEFMQHAPWLAKALGPLADALGSSDPAGRLASVYERLETKSIDYAVMEKADRVLVVETGYHWNDVGSWASVRELLSSDADGNVVDGRHVGIDSSNLIVFTEGDHLVATIGVEELVIVATKDATLVMKADEAQRTKEMVELLRMLGHEEVT